MLNLSTVRLGRRAHDAQRVAAVQRHVAASAPPPPVLDRSAVPWAAPGEYRNSVLPVCTCAGLANSFRAQSWIANRTDQVTALDPVLAFFARVVGCADTEAAIAATDGAVVLDVLECARDSGFNLGQQTPAVPLYAAIDPADRLAIASVMATRGSAYLGIDLHAEDLTPDADWTAPPVGPVEGGHLVLSWAYDGLADDDRVTLATWGAWKTASWAWLLSRTRESYSLTWA